MGIKGFSKVFKSTRIVKLKDLKDQTITIDAMTEIYRSALGAKSVSTLTDRAGNPTLHINVILANVIEMQRCGIKQMWVFDHDQDATTNANFHNPAKLEELAKRQKRKDCARATLEALEDKPKVLFSDSEDDSCDEAEETVDTTTKTTAKTAASTKSVADAAAHQSKKSSLEKQLFSATKQMINDVKLIFNCLNIRYIEAPAGYEGEQIAAYLSATDQCDAVYSGDTDPIPFGAKVLLRKNPRDKKIYEYAIDDIYKQMTENCVDYATVPPTIKDLRKLCVIMGSDFAPKTPRIGDKTVMKKLHTIKLTVKQRAAIKQFEKEPLEDIPVFNLNKEPFTDTNISILLDWLVNDKAFSRSRMTTMFSKVMQL